MEQNVPSTAGRRQFNDTAVAKLVAEGVPRNVATAFVNHGIDKSGRYTQLRDHVCKMEYVRYLLPRTVEDYKDPMRIGQLAPYVEEQKSPRFFTEFAMTDIEAARFTSGFPEFTIVPRGTTYNQHGFYANKRYAEAELLVGMVFEHARRNGSGWDPKSLVDVGGNEVWHGKRDRAYVHNDNPILSARDVARYTAREVFSGATGKTTCDKKFSECTHKSQYGMAVHSTYDFSPKALAFGMCKRDIKVFFLVMNVVPGLGSMAPGQYEVDGMVITLHRPSRAPAYVSYTFKHDASLEYRHPLFVHQAYMQTRAVYHVTRPDGSVLAYTYRILSVRGNSLVATMELTNTVDYSPHSYLFAGPTRKVYYISIKMMDVDNLEVDREFFDRLVLQASGARGAENYDIVSLYKYAKSLRQRVSINGIVLSSGYTMSPEHLVTTVIASYALAAAFRVESAGFFKEASSQIHARRGQGFLRDILRVAGRSFLAPFAALASVLGTVSYYTKADRKLKAIIASQGAVRVVVDKPHAGAGTEYNPAMLLPTPKVDRDGKVLTLTAGTESWVTPLQPGGWDAKLVTSVVSCAGKDKIFLSYSIPRLDDRELPKGARPQFYDMSTVASDRPMKSEEYRSQLYAATLRKIVGAGAFEIVPLVLPIGDRLYRKRLRPMDGEVALSKGSRMVTDSDTYVVFRGVGDKAVSLTPPECYSRGTCLRFVLFYVDEVSDKVRSARAGKQVGVVSEDVAVVVTQLAGGSVAHPAVGPNTTVYHEMDAVLSSDSSDWETLSPSASTRKVVSFSEHGSDPDFVHTRLSAGEFYMTGALGVGTPPVSLASSDTLVYTTRRPSLPVLEEEVVSGGAPALPGRVRTESEEAVAAVAAEVDLFDDVDSDAGQVDADFVGLGISTGVLPGSSVSSSDVVWGREALTEQIALCDAARDVALASSAEVIDLAVAVARGEAPVSVWGAAMEGKQGSPLPVQVKGELFVNAVTGEVVNHMAVSDGLEVYDRVSKPPPDGLYVTSDVMAVYTGSAVKESIARVQLDPFQCPVTNMNGVAGSGKTYTIVHEAKLGDVVLCETKGALKDTAARLFKSGKPWDGAAWTMDSFLLHVPRTECEVLWIDESLRLHAAKIFAAVKLLKPVSVYCFGDNKQIPILPFVPGFDFSFSSFPFTSVTVKRDTWRSPADVCFVTSHPMFYGFHVRTHNRLMRSIKGPRLFEQGMFHAKADDVVLLTYTQVAKEDLLKAGVKNVMTVGESQGSTFKKVVLFRDSMLGKPLYNDVGQSLVAITRHTEDFEYVTVAVNDTSTVAEAIKYLRSKVSVLLLASHSFSAQRSPVVVVGSDAADDADSEWEGSVGVPASAVSTGYASDWADSDPSGLA